MLGKYGKQKFAVKYQNQVVPHECPRCKPRVRSFARSNVLLEQELEQDTCTYISLSNPGDQLSVPKIISA